MIERRKTDRQMCSMRTAPDRAPRWLVIGMLFACTAVWAGLLWAVLR